MAAKRKAGKKAMSPAQKAALKKAQAAAAQARKKGSAKVAPKPPGPNKGKTNSKSANPYQSTKISAKNIDSNSSTITKALKQHYKGTPWQGRSVQGMSNALQLGVKSGVITRLEVRSHGPVFFKMKGSKGVFSNSALEKPFVRSLKKRSLDALKGKG
jgi:hypothetical protein